MTIDDDKLTELERLANAATPAQWHEPSLFSGLRFLSRHYEPYGEDCPAEQWVPNHGDAAFIAAARAAIPELLAEVRRLRDLNGAWAESAATYMKEADALRAEVESLRVGIDTAMACVVDKAKIAERCDAYEVAIGKLNALVDRLRAEVADLQQRLDRSAQEVVRRGAVLEAVRRWDSDPDVGLDCLVEALDAYDAALAGGKEGS